MWNPSLWLLAIALVLGSPSSASAFGISFVESGSTIDLADGSFTVDVRLDAPTNPGLQAFSVAVLFDPTVLSYDSAASRYTGEDPSFSPYILYAPGNGTYMVPVGTDPPGLWPTPPPGLAQINVNWQEVSFGTTSATGSDIPLAILGFDVVDPTVMSEIRLSLGAGGNVFVVNGVPLSASEVTLGAPVQLVPEPATGLLAALGVLGLVALSRRHPLQGPVIWFQRGDPPAVD